MMRITRGNRLTPGELGGSQVRRHRPGLLVFALLYVALYFSACGSAQRSQPAFAPADELSLQDDFAAPALQDARVIEPGMTCDSAVMRSHVLELAAETTRAAEVIAAALRQPADDASQVICVLRLLELARSYPQALQVSGGWLVESGLEAPTWLERFARRELAFLVRQDQRERGEPMLWSDVELGAPNVVQVYGPTGTRILEAFPGEDAIEDTRSLASLPESPVVDSGLNDAISGSFELDGASGGVAWAETFFEVGDDFHGYIVVASDSPVRAWINDRELFTRTLADGLRSPYVVVRVTLNAGEHRLRLKAASPGNAQLLVRILPDEGQLVAFSPEPTTSRLAEVASVSATATISDALQMEGSSLLRALVEGELAYLFGGEAEILAAQARLRGQSHAIARRLNADLFAVREDLPPSRRRSEALQMLRTIDTSDPSAAMIAVETAALLRGAGSADAAQQVLEEAVGDDTAVPAELRFALAELYREEGWSELAEAYYEEVVAAQPDRCAAVDALLAIRQSRGQYDASEQLPESWRRCPSVREYHAYTELASLRDYAGMLAFARERASVEPDSGGPYADWIAAAELAGQPEEIAAAEAQAFRYGFDEQDFALIRADLAAGGGDEAAALALLQRRSDERTWWSSAHLGAARLSGEVLWDELRVDGEEIAEAYRSQQHAYNSDVVYVYDGGVWHYRPDGSAIVVVHQIMELRSRDALGAFGEVGVPRDATLLTVRTIKPDGRMLVPEDIAEKTSISMPNLEVGDMIELEWVSYEAPPRSPDEWISSGRFYFQIEDGPLHESIARFSYPSEWGEAVTIEAHAFGGEHHVEEADGRRTETYRVQNSPLPEREPAAPANDEFVPWVHFARGFTQERLLGAFRDRIATHVLSGAALQEQVEELRHRSARDTVEALFRFVQDDIEELGGFFSTPALWTLAEGQGERLPLMYTMLQEAGIDAEIVFIRPLDADHSAQQLPTLGTYSITALRVRVGEDEIWLAPGDEYAVFDYLEPYAQGRPAIIVTGRDAGEALVTPRWPAETNVARTRMHFAVAADGSAVVDVEERVPLRSAGALRQYLDFVPSEREVLQNLESGLANDFPGATVEELRFEQVEDSDRELIIRYRFEAPSVFASEGGRLRFDKSIYSRADLRRYASLPSRELPLVATNMIAERYELTFDAPAGMVWGDVSPSERSEWEEAFIERQTAVSEDGATLRATREVFHRPQRIAPEDYEGFAEFVRSVIRLEQLRFVAEPGEGAQREL